jgi:hypothetical protein
MMNDRPDDALKEKNTYYSMHLFYFYLDENLVTVFVFISGTWLLQCSRHVDQAACRYRRPGDILHLYMLFYSYKQIVNGESQPALTVLN